MYIKQSQTKFRTLKQDNPDFMLRDGYMVAQRAGFEISNQCPDNYKTLIHECISHGWLKPVATVYDHEITFQRLMS